MSSFSFTCPAGVGGRQDDTSSHSWYTAASQKPVKPSLEAAKGFGGPSQQQQQEQQQEQQQRKVSFLDRPVMKHLSTAASWRVTATRGILKAFGLVFNW
jgi:hypothetical protein